MASESKHSGGGGGGGGAPPRSEPSSSSEISIESIGKKQEADRTKQLEEYKTRFEKLEIEHVLQSREHDEQDTKLGVNKDEFIHNLVTYRTAKRFLWMCVIWMFVVVFNAWGVNTGKFPNDSGDTNKKVVNNPLNINNKLNLGEVCCNNANYTFVDSLCSWRTYVPLIILFCIFFISIFVNYYGTVPWQHYHRTVKMNGKKHGRNWTIIGIAAILFVLECMIVVQSSSETAPGNTPLSIPQPGTDASTPFTSGTYYWYDPVLCSSGNCVSTSCSSATVAPNPGYVLCPMVGGAGGNLNCCQIGQTTPCPYTTCSAGQIKAPACANPTYYNATFIVFVIVIILIVLYMAYKKWFGHLAVDSAGELKCDLEKIRAYASSHKTAAGYASAIHAIDTCLSHHDLKVDTTEYSEMVAEGMNLRILLRAREKVEGRTDQINLLSKYKNEHENLQHVEIIGRGLSERDRMGGGGIGIDDRASKMAKSHYDKHDEDIEIDKILTFKPIDPDQLQEQLRSELDAFIREAKAGISEEHGLAAGVIRKINNGLRSLLGVPKLTETNTIEWAREVSEKREDYIKDMVDKQRAASNSYKELVEEVRDMIDKDTFTVANQRKIMRKNQLMGRNTYGIVRMTDARDISGHSVANKESGKEEDIAAIRAASKAEGKEEGMREAKARYDAEQTKNAEVKRQIAEEVRRKIEKREQREREQREREQREREQRERLERERGKGEGGARRE
jgi:hypothetical protein